MFWHQRLLVHIVLIGGLAIFNLLAHYFGATSLLRSGSFLGRGSISSLMVLTTGLFALYGWKRMLENARLNDERIQSLVSDIEALEKSQESQKHWRDLVIRVHETTLNTIRSILTLKDTPIEELQLGIEQSLRQDRALMSKAQERRSGSVIGAIRAGIDNAAVREKVRIISQGVNPMAIRWALLNRRYREDAMWSETLLNESVLAIDRLQLNLAKMEVAPTDGVITEVIKALSEDLDTERAIRVVENWMDDTDSGQSGGNAGELSRALDTLLGIAL